MKAPTRSDMAVELIELACDMEVAAKRLAYLGGFDPHASDRAEELTGAAGCVREWAKQLRKRRGKARTTRP